MLLTAEQKQNIRSELLNVCNGDKDAFSLSFITYKTAFSRTQNKQIKVNPWTYINFNEGLKRLTTEQLTQVNSVLQKYQSYRNI